MIIITGKIVDEIDKDTYKCVIEIPGTGKVQGFPVRFENEPIIGDEVLCILFTDPFGNSAYYIPLKTLSKPDGGMSTFTGIYREGFKLEFDDNGIHLSGKKTREGDGTDKSSIDLTEDEIKIKEGDTEISLKEGNKSVKITDGVGKMELTNGKLEISGFTSTIKMGGSVAPNPLGGPFCALQNCLFSGAPHQGDIVSQ